MVKKIGIGLIIIALVLGIATCGAHRGQHHLDQEKILRRVTKKLDLNEMQQGKFKVVLDNATQFKVAWDANHFELRNVLTEQLYGAELNEVAVNAQMSVMEAQFSAFRSDIVSDFATFHATLDASQRDKVAGLLQKMERHKRY